MKKSLTIIAITLLALGMLIVVGCEVKVPNVTGQSYIVARSLLTSNGFKVEVKDPETHKVITPGAGATVTGQSPSGGSKSSTRAVVTLYVKSQSKPTQ
jgi:hypothetical protein